MQTFGCGMPWRFSYRSIGLMPSRLRAGTSLMLRKERDVQQSTTIGFGCDGNPEGPMTDAQLRDILARRDRGESLAQIARAYGMTCSGAAGVCKRLTDDYAASV